MIPHRNGFHEIPLQQILMLTESDGHILEYHSLILELLSETMIYDLTVILGTDSGKHFSLCLRDTETIEGIFYRFRDIIPGLRVTSSLSFRKIINTLQIEGFEGWSPGRFRKCTIFFEGFESMYEHPFRLIIRERDLTDN
jgi:hypothetical protein